MADNNKNLPNISGTETIKDSWQRLLVRDSNISNLFAGNAFTTDPSTQVEGTPNWREDLSRLFIYIEGQGFVNLFTLLEPSEVSFKGTEFPDSVTTIQSALDYLSIRKQDSSIVLPGQGQIFEGDGTTHTYPLQNSTETKNNIFCYIDGVKQKSSDFILGENSDQIILNVAPNRGETIEIIENSSWLQYRISPVVKTFEYESGPKVFNMEVALPVKESVSVNVAGKILQRSEYQVSGTQVTVLIPLTVGTSVEISTMTQTNLVVPGPGSVSTSSLQNNIISNQHIDSLSIKNNWLEDGAVSTAKLAPACITQNKLTENLINTNHIVDGAVLMEKLSDLVVSKLLGNKNVLGENIADKAIGVEHISDSLRELING